MNALLMTDVGTGLFVFLLGLSVVFFGMIIIVLVITVIGKIMKANDDKKAKKAVSAPAVEDALPTAEGDDTKVVAAIIAAITAYYFAENNDCEFKVKRIKRI